MKAKNGQRPYVSVAELIERATREVHQASKPGDEEIEQLLDLSARQLGVALARARELARASDDDLAGDGPASALAARSASPGRDHADGEDPAGAVADATRGLAVLLGGAPVPARRPRQDTRADTSSPLVPQRSAFVPARPAAPAAARPAATPAVPAARPAATPAMPAARPAVTPAMPAARPLATPAVPTAARPAVTARPAATPAVPSAARPLGTPAASARRDAPAFVPSGASGRPAAAPGVSARSGQGVRSPATPAGRSQEEALQDAELASAQLVLEAALADLTESIPSEEEADFLPELSGEDTLLPVPQPAGAAPGPIEPAPAPIAPVAVDSVPDPARARGRAARAIERAWTDAELGPSDSHTMEIELDDDLLLSIEEADEAEFEEPPTALFPRDAVLDAEAVVQEPVYDSLAASEEAALELAAEAVPEPLSGPVGRARHAIDPLVDALSRELDVDALDADGLLASDLDALARPSSTPAGLASIDADRDPSGSSMRVDSVLDALSALQPEQADEASDPLARSQPAVEAALDELSFESESFDETEFDDDEEPFELEHLVFQGGEEMDAKQPVSPPPVPPARPAPPAPSAPWDSRPAPPRPPQLTPSGGRPMVPPPPAEPEPGEPENQGGAGKKRGFFRRIFNKPSS